MSAVAGLALLGAVPAHATEKPEKPETSANVKHVANVPKQGPFAAEDAYNTDLAFQGRYAYQGNYNGFTVYDIGDPAKPRVVSRVSCPGAQNDVSVVGKLLFLSVDESRTGDSCSSEYGSPTDKGAWEGIRIFDISDKARPKYIKAVKTACGSHTHTLVPDKKGKAVYLYVSSYGPGDILAGCKPPHDKISIVKVPLKKPTAAKVVATPVLFPEQSGGPTTSGCHDITVYPAKDLAAGACMGDGVLLDIADREKPKVTARVTDENFAFWHSATFNNAGTKVFFTDELGGGAAGVCDKATGPERGADAVYDISGVELAKRAYFKIPRTQDKRQNCVAHNGSLIPVKGKDIMVQAWYQGGVSFVDFTDPARPQEIGYFERPPFKGSDIAGSWSAYYYNGYVYSSDIQKGLDVLRIDDPRTDPAKNVKFKILNTQTQYGY
ncbi:LVIVD repeat-containing protein [Nonomuraea sp. NPDC059023]|uniref:LVIVD repeat-containing protein n=1 Tax=unclassified Nonomuraea TaxID=2593643 RepID=UPI00367D695B